MAAAACAAEVPEPAEATYDLYVSALIYMGLVLFAMTILIEVQRKYMGVTVWSA